MIDNYKQTGNIIFPYYNSIFKSKYFGLFNWTDERFTLKGIKDILLSPIINCVINPDYGHTISAEKRNYIFGIGYIFVILYLIYKIIFKKKKDIFFQIALISLVSTYMWAIFLKGYMRYGIYLAFLYLILICSIITNILSHIYIKYIKSIDLINFIFNVIIKFYFFIIILYILSYCIITISNLHLANLQYLFKDRENEKYQVHIDGVWGAPKDCCSYEVVLREPSTPIYSLNKEFFKDSETSLKMWKEKINNNDIYTIIEFNPYNTSIPMILLKESNFKIEKIVDSYTSEDIPYIDANSTWYLVKVKYAEN